jgi:hypothetical protein
MALLSVVLTSCFSNASDDSSTASSGTEASADQEWQGIPDGKELAHHFFTDTRRVYMLHPSFNPDSPRDKDGIVEEVAGICCDCVERYDPERLMAYYKVKQQEAVEAGGLNIDLMRANPFAPEYHIFKHVLNCLNLMMKYPELEGMTNAESKRFLQAVKATIYENCKQDFQTNMDVQQKLEALNRRTIPMELDQTVVQEVIVPFSQEYSSPVGSGR